MASAYFSRARMAAPTAVCAAIMVVIPGTTMVIVRWANFPCWPAFLLWSASTTALSLSSAKRYFDAKL